MVSTAPSLKDDQVVVKKKYGLAIAERSRDLYTTLCGKGISAPFSLNW
jgi:hypothetical protein